MVGFNEAKLYDGASEDSKVRGSLAIDSYRHNAVPAVVGICIMTYGLPFVQRSREATDTGLMVSPLSPD